MANEFLPVAATARSRTRHDETHAVTTADGWQLSLLRYRPKGRHARGEPVLLHHGLGSSSDVFDLGLDCCDPPTPSLARWLSFAGYDVWVCDLRGSWRSRPADGQRATWDWSVDDHVNRDDTAFVDYILAQTKRESLHWVGHSLGGILLLCYCALYGSPRIASGSVVAAGLDGGGAGSLYRFCAPFGPIARRLHRMPMSWLSLPLAPLAGRGLFFEQANYVPANVAPTAARAVHRLIQDVSGNVLAQLASLFRPGGFRSLDGTRSYAALAANIQTPMLLLAGEKDHQFPPVAIARTFRLLRGSQHKTTLIGRHHGQREDYGHQDLLVGIRADREVYPRILDWLAAHPIPAPAT